MIHSVNPAVEFSLDLKPLAIVAISAFDGGSLSDACKPAS